MPHGQRELIAWATILTAHAQAGIPNHARRVFHEMQAWDHLAHDACFTNFLLACSRDGRVDQSRQCFGSMSVDFGLRPSKQHYCCVIDALGRAGHVDDAYGLVAGMPYVADAVDWLCFLSSCKSSCKSYGHFQRRRLAVENVLELEPRNGPAYIVLANAARIDGVDLRPITPEREEKTNNR
ncbi:hypothetical protein SELMODRAFT_132146 [Selaginella moellendorffii]|uniref:Pentacotripeptide-repeat region of PRORP domain-containing protein n=2 Tax=Selaginella moellendorffii TaxID=88036 RepID=D8T4V3_SELML|nr:hypothetical protein SELMODRAFT_132146 [Selaginella moellendorffii]